ncbi:class I SAM-dependent methyltransferase [Roseiconus nitratireducens]|uniref:Class I SAM-dependent methyltransferase n=1 Tax=Roseiconus nitratireducens TaxID=2605748 RepID=A0A5M6DF63_9BACT|nr:class I SAM-dependent methyltransferase [Roseiconus nitratireducens]KAA5543835.1 class I SAM-dependent methyltransferase [Roseiconus nitratireducens]
MLQAIELPSLVNSERLPAEIAERLASLRLRIEHFQDCWDQHRAEQFVAADYELVFQALRWLGECQPMIGRRFLEWGCGFAVVSCLADQLGWNAHAVEAHPDLVPQAEKTIRQWPARVELFAGNFLPHQAESLAADPTLPSLGHGGPSPYEAWDLDLDDFALVYSYPWPGEDEFHEDVFDAYAAPGALLLMFIGPNEMRLWRKGRPDRR